MLEVPKEIFIAVEVPKILEGKTVNTKTPYLERERRRVTKDRGIESCLWLVPEEQSSDFFLSTCVDWHNSKEH